MFASFGSVRLANTTVEFEFVELALRVLGRSQEDGWVLYSDEVSILFVW